MSKMPLTIYLPASLGVQIRRAAERECQSQSSFIVELLQRHFATDVDPHTVLISSQLARLLAVAEEWIEVLPEDMREDAKWRIGERAAKYKKAAQARLKP